MTSCEWTMITITCVKWWMLFVFQLMISQDVLIRKWLWWCHLRRSLWAGFLWRCQGKNAQRKRPGIDHGANCTDRRGTHGRMSGNDKVSLSRLWSDTKPKVCIWSHVSRRRSSKIACKSRRSCPLPGTHTLCPRGQRHRPGFLTGGKAPVRPL